ncbi:hypothetical protein GC167_05175 [bacterium]|nr:hypothetical protein [bacterium]
MKTILVPTDFSANADKALDFALDIAPKMGAKLHIFNAFDLPYSQNVMTTSLLDALRESSEAGLKELAKRIEGRGVVFVTESKLGNPISVSRELVRREKVDLLILGTRGASGIEEVLIGSNAAAILHAVDCPVLAIPSHSKPEPIQDIAFATDGNTKGETLALPRLKMLAEVFGARIHILHVFDPESTELSVINEAHYRKQLEGVDLLFALVEKNKSIEKSILEYAENNNIDVLALLARRYGFLQSLFHNSLTSRIAYHSRLPFLTLHED